MIIIIIIIKYIQDNVTNELITTSFKIEDNYNNQGGWGGGGGGGKVTILFST